MITELCGRSEKNARVTSSVVTVQSRRENKFIKIKIFITEINKRCRSKRPMDK